MSRSNLLFTATFFIFLCVLGTYPVMAQSDGQNSGGPVNIESIQLDGIRVWSRSDMRTLLNEVGLREGIQLSREDFKSRVNQAIERFYNEGLFSDIRARLEDNTLVFEFEEYPRVSNIVFRGNKNFDQGTLMDVLLLQRDEPASGPDIKRARKQVEEFYHRKGFGNASVEVKKEQAVSGRVVVIFEIDEGHRESVAEVFIEYKGGKNPFAQIGQNWSIRWALPLKTGDPYSPQKVEEAKRMIQGWYHNRGHLDVSIDVETRQLTRDRGLELTFVIDEGPVYRMGNVTIQNNTIFSTAELRKMIPLKEGDVFSKRLMGKGLKAIENRYNDRGYSDATVFDPSHFRIVRDKKSRRANLKVRVEEGKPYYVEKIELRGNKVTYDKVIMREVTLEEGKLLDGKKKRNSLRRLKNLGYFENVEMNVDPGSKENSKIVRLRVKERPTGELSFGGGFSSSTGFVGSLSVSKDNFSLYDWSNGFTGRGQSISVSASIGRDQDNFNISWDDPWFNDDLDQPDEPAPEVPISFGWSAFNTQNERIEGFDEIRSGGSLRLGREFGEALSNKIDIEYSFQSTEVDNLSDADDPPDRFIDEAQRTSGDSDGFKRDIGSLTLGLQRDRRDDRRFPSEGYLLRGNTEVASELLGGNTKYYKPEFDSRSYIPFWFGSFWAWRVNYKTIDTWADDTNEQLAIPSFEEFFLGGQGTVRGYESNDIALYDDPCPGSGNSSDGEFSKCSGGKSAIYTNVELRFQLIEKTMQMFMFGDAGQVSPDPWDVDTSDVKKSAGIGFRVRSPIGPINLSWGQRLDNTYPGADDKGDVQLDFSIGSGF